MQLGMSPESPGGTPERPGGWSAGGPGRETQNHNNTRKRATVRGPRLETLKTPAQRTTVLAGAPKRTFFGNAWQTDHRAEGPRFAVEVRFSLLV